MVTWNIQSLGPTLKAIKTRLAWTVHGQVNERTKVVHCSKVVALRACTEQSGVISTPNKFSEKESAGIKNEAPAHRDDNVVPEFGKDILIKDRL